MKFLKLTAIVGLPTVILFLTACPQPPDNPVEPHISMKYLIVADTIDALENRVKRFTFVFDLIDGDGDIGLKESDTTGIYSRDGEYHYNCFIEMYELDEDDTTHIQLNAPLRYRIPYVEPAGGNQNLEAEVHVNVDLTIGHTLLDYEFIMFELFIYDRALNKSNIIQSPIVPFEGEGIYAPDQREKAEHL